ncbi:MAG: tetratricopeptide repeat protein [Bacteroidota bacterium]
MNKKTENLLLLLLILIAVTLTYSNHFNNPFEFDDGNQIEDNIFIRDLKNIPTFFKDATTSSTLTTHQTYRPIVLTTLAIDYYLGKGLTPLYFHISTFFWFLVQLVIMFFLFRKILFKITQHIWTDYIALFAVAMYGLHPANAETINYIYQRGDSLSTLCVVAAFYIFIAYPEKRKKFLYLIPAVIGMFTKEPAAMFAPILFFYVLLFETKNSLSDIFSNKGLAIVIKAVRQTLPAFIVCVAGALLVVKMQNSAWEPGGSSRFNYFITQPWVLFHYFFTFFIPANLSADTDLPAFKNLFEERIYAGLAFMFVMIVIAFKTSKKEETKPIAFGILWFFISLIPTSSLVPLAEVTNDHRMFFPFAGLTLSVAWSIGLFIIKRQVTMNRNVFYKYGIIVFGFLVLSSFATGTRQRNKVWHSSESLWYDVTIKGPQNGRGLMNYGLTQMAIGKYDIALNYFTKALIYTPYYSTLHVNLAIVNNAMDKPAEAEDYYKKAIQFSPKYPKAYYYYAEFLFKKERFQDALYNAELALSLGKADLDTRHLLMKIYNSSRENEKLEALVKETLQIAPGDSFSSDFLANKNKGLSAFQSEEQTVEKNPTASNCVNLSLAYYSHGMYDKCIAAAEKALELEPQNKFAYNNIGSAWCALKQREKAIEACTKALQIDPNFERAKNNLNWAKANLK